jgi:hypothetical protein
MMNNPAHRISKPRIALAGTIRYSSRWLPRLQSLGITLVVALTVATRPTESIAQGSIYYTSDDDEFIHVVGLDGSNPRRLIDLEAVFGPGDYKPFGIAVDDDHIYWTGYGSGDALFTAGLNGENPRILNDDIRGFDLVISEGRLYGMRIRGSNDGWTKAVWSAAIDGGDFTLFDVVSGHTDNGIAVSGSRLFWTSREGEFATIETSDIDGGNAHTLVDLNVEFGDQYYLPYPITATGSAIYWAEGRACCSDTIWTAGLDGDNPRKLADIPRTAQTLVAYGDRLLWTSDSGNHPSPDSVYSSDLDGNNITKLFQTDTTDIVGMAISAPNFTPSPRPFMINDVSIVSSTPFLQTIRVAWSSEIAGHYRLLVSRDMASWISSGHDDIVSRSFETEAEVTLPLDWEKAFFKVEKLPAGQ